MLCPMCQVHEMLSTNPEVDCCIDCQRTGRRFEFYLTNPIRSNVLGRIREMEGVLSANLWPSTPGAWQIGVILWDGRLITTGGALVVDENEDTIIIAPAIPPLGSKWIMSVKTPVAGEDEWMDGTSEIMEEVYDDDELVDAIALLAAPA